MMVFKRTSWLYAAVAGLSACISNPGPPNSRLTATAGSVVDIADARAISLVSQNNSAFSSRLVHDILFEDVTEGYRFTRVGVFYDSLSLSVYSENGVIRGAILSGLPTGFQKKEDSETYELASSAFGEINVTEEDFSHIAAAFAALDVCNFLSDSKDFESTDGEAWAYEVIKDSRYCFAWAGSSDHDGFLEPARAMFPLFGIQPNFGVELN